MANENSTHPVQTVSYGTVLGIILFIVFIIILLLIIYFLFGDCILNSYCYIINDNSCYCPNPPECCLFLPGVAGSCQFEQDKEKSLRAYCANNPCYEDCIHDFGSPIQNLIYQSGIDPECPRPDPVIVEQGTQSVAHLCQFKDLCGFNPVTTICGIPDINVCEPGVPLAPLELKQCALPQCGVNKNKNMSCELNNCFIPITPVQNHFQNSEQSDNTDTKSDTIAVSSINNIISEFNNTDTKSDTIKLNNTSNNIDKSELNQPPTPGLVINDDQEEASPYNSDYSPYNEEYSPYHT